MIAVLISFVLILVIDIVWIGMIMASFYIDRLGDLGRLVDGKFEPLLIPAAVVYLLLSVGISYFALRPAGEPVGTIFFRGALLGLVIYGTYDMTNMATLSRWPISLAVVDMAWGSLLCGSVAVITHWVTTKFGWS